MSVTTRTRRTTRRKPQKAAGTRTTGGRPSTRPRSRTPSSGQRRGGAAASSQGPAPLSLRAYARHRQVSHQSVMRALPPPSGNGRLQRSVRKINGRWRIIDVALADQEWAANTDLTRAPDDVKAKASAAPPPGHHTSLPVNTSGRDSERGRVIEFHEPQAHGGALKREQLVPDDSIAAASAEEKRWRAKKAELDYKRAAGEVINAKELQTRLVTAFTTCRTKVLGLSTRAKAQLPHLTLEDVTTLDALAREALEELARFEAAT